MVVSFPLKLHLLSTQRFTSYVVIFGISACCYLGVSYSKHPFLLQKQFILGAALIWHIKTVHSKRTSCMSQPLFFLIILYSSLTTYSTERPSVFLKTREHLINTSKSFISTIANISICFKAMTWAGYIIAILFQFNILIILSIFFDNNNLWEPHAICWNTITLQSFI